MFDSIKQKIADTFANLPKPDITVTVMLLFIFSSKTENKSRVKPLSPLPSLLPKVSPRTLLKPVLLPASNTPKNTTVLSAKAFPAPKPKMIKNTKVIQNLSILTDHWREIVSWNLSLLSTTSESKSSGTQVLTCSVKVWKICTEPGSATGQPLNQVSSTIPLPATKSFPKPTTKRSKKKSRNTPNKSNPTKESF
jgi:hypothetical protein